MLDNNNPYRTEKTATTELVDDQQAEPVELKYSQLQHSGSQWLRRAQWGLRFLAIVFLLLVVCIWHDSGKSFNIIKASIFLGISVLIWLSGDLAKKRTKLSQFHTILFSIFLAIQNNIYMLSKRAKAPAILVGLLCAMWLICFYVLLCFAKYKKIKSTTSGGKDASPLKILALMQSQSSFMKGMNRSTIRQGYKITCGIWGKLRRFSWLDISFFALMFTAAISFFVLDESTGTPIGLYCLAILLAIGSYVLSWPSLCCIIELTKRATEDREVFVDGIQISEPAVSFDFAITVRRALAKIYCVPEDMISHKDNKKSLSKFCKRDQPLAIELLYGVYVLSDIEPDIEKLYELTARYEMAIPDSVPHLIGVVYKLMYEDCEKA